jgi:amino acid adenylation domain-containing protein
VPHGNVVKTQNYSEMPVVPIPGPEKNDGALAEITSSLSIQQKRLWSAQSGWEFLSSRLCGRIKGNIDSRLLLDSFRCVSRKYEILQTTFRQGQKGAISSLVSMLDSLTWTERDLRGFSMSEQGRNVEGWPWWFGTDSVSNSGTLDLTLFRLSEDTYQVLLRAPAMCADSQSLENLWNEAVWYYAHATELVGDEVLQYSDYARWQQELMNTEELLEADVPRLNELRERPGNLPSSASLPDDARQESQYLEFQVSEEIVARIQKTYCSAQVGMEKILLAAWLGFLSLYRKSSKLCVAVSINGRPTEVLKNAIGLFELYVPVFVSVERNDMAASLLRSAQTALAAADQYQHGIKWTEPGIENLKAQFAEFGFSWAECLGDLHEGGTEFSCQARYSQIENFTLALHGCWSEEGLRCALQYDGSRIQAAVVNELQNGFVRCLQEIATSPDRPVGKLESFANAQHQILEKWNATAQDFPCHRCLHQLFEEQAEKTPKAIAVRYGEKCVTFEELNTAANQVAHELHEFGAGPETLVGICLKRSPEMVIGVLGILKAGAAYVPIDPSLPRARVALLLQDTGTAIVLTNRNLSATLPADACLLVYLDDHSSVWSQETRNPENQAIPGNAAYVLYTSGSTGDPKGVVIPHVGIVNYLHWCRSAYALQEGQGAPVQSSLSFDLTLTSLFGPLLVGRTTFLLEEQDAISGLVAAITPRADFSLLKITPAHLAIMNHHLLQPLGSTAPARVLVVGGEALGAETVSLWLEKFPATTLVNEYGPTETVVGCCVHFIRKGQRLTRTVPIGRPIANTRLYVLDADGQPILDHTSGELYIGGVGVGRGYLNSPRLTAEKFLPDPYSPVAGARMYRTGDLAFRRADGELEYVGRMDRQVKIHGFRIELGEIEAVLCHSGAVFECAVEATAGLSGEKALTAWVVPRSGEKPKAAGLREFLSERLPYYMVPSSFVIVSSLPLTPNGKVDRKALLKLTEQESAQPFVPPRNETELKILEVWEEVMQITPISVTENFFAIGGNSMLAVRIISRLERLLDKPLSLALLFEHKTIEELAVALGRPVLLAKAPSLIRIQAGNARRPLFLVHPMGGGVFGYAHLARRLGKDQPVYGLQSSGLHSGSPCRTIEEMAAQYIDAIAEVDAKGPYLLGGWSMGGVIAFEMAQQLIAQGHEVSLLVLIDSHPRPVPNEGSFQRVGDSILREVVDEFRRVYGDRFQWEDRYCELSRHEQISLLLECMKQLHIVAPDTHEAELSRILDLQTAHTEALAAYIPKQYRRKLVLFRSSENAPEDPDREDNASLGWEQYSSLPVEIHFSSGRHDEMILEPHVSGLAMQLRSLLDSSGA